MRPTNTESYESGLDSIRDYIKYLKELAGTGATDEIEFTLNRIGDYWGDILYQKHVTKPSPRARPATLRQFAETMQKKVDKLPQKDPRTAYLRPEVNPVTKKLKRTATEDLRSPAEKAFGLEAGEAYGEDETPVTDMGVLRHGKHVVEFSRNEHTSAVTGWVKGIGDICFASNKQDAVNAAKRFLDAYQAALDAGATEKDAKNQARAARDKKTAKVSKGDTMTKKLKNTPRVAAVLRKMVRDASQKAKPSPRKAGLPKTRRLANDLRSPNEKMLGLQEGELYGADETVMTDVGSMTYKGFKVEFLYNEESGVTRAWVKGVGTVGSSWTAQAARDEARKVLDKYKQNLDAGMTSEDARLKARDDVARRVASKNRLPETRRVASKSVHFTGELIVYREEKEETIQVDFEVPVTGTYAEFVKALEQKLGELAGEGPDYSVDLSVDFIYSNDKTPLRLWLEAKQAPNHPATELFYDWVCSHYSWYDERDIEALSKRGGGFADTDFTWDYYESADQLVNEVGYVYESEPDLYTTDDDGNEILKSPEEQADYLWGIISNSNDVLEARQNELETGDYFVIRYA